MPGTLERVNLWRPRHKCLVEFGWSALTEGERGQNLKATKAQHVGEQQISRRKLTGAIRLGHSVYGGRLTKQLLYR